MKKITNLIGMFTLYDGHLRDRVASYLKANLFNNILKEVIIYSIILPRCKIV
jgi:protein phosphatase 1L